jgi:hypothetical protein
MSERILVSIERVLSESALSMWPAHHTNSASRHHCNSRKQDFEKRKLRSRSISNQCGPPRTSVFFHLTLARVFVPDRVRDKSEQLYGKAGLGCPDAGTGSNAGNHRKAEGCFIGIVALRAVETGDKSFTFQATFDSMRQFQW